MFGDHPFLADSVAREPDKPLTSKDAWNCAWIAAEMAKTIRTYLPVKGKAKVGHESWRVQENAAQTVCNLYRATEKIRNPQKYPFGPGRGTSDSFDFWHEGLHTPWHALCEAIDRVAEFYGWQAASTGATYPSMPDVRSYQESRQEFTLRGLWRNFTGYFSSRVSPIPAIDTALLEAVHNSAETICEICRIAADNERRVAKDLHACDNATGATEDTAESRGDEQFQQKVAKGSNDAQLHSATRTDNASAETADDVTNEQLATLTLVSVSTFQNRASERKDRPGPKGKAGKANVYSYREQRPWFKKHWQWIPDDRLPESYVEAMSTIRPNCPAGK